LVCVWVRREASSHPLVSVNSRLPIAKGLGLHFHTGIHGPSVEAAREELGQDVLIGFSAHTHEEADEAVFRGADYLFFSPMFEPAGKPGYPAAGIGALRTFCRRFEGTVPVFALGGITPDRAAGCLEAGASGVAVLSGIMEADDVEEAVREYLAVVDESPRH
jgi:thiamine-phosphate pyrophosphorylase